MKRDIYRRVIESRRAGSLSSEWITLYVTSEVNGFAVFLRYSSAGDLIRRSAPGIQREPIAWFDSRDDAIEFGVRYSPESPLFKESS